MCVTTAPHPPGSLSEPFEFSELLDEYRDEAREQVARLDEALLVLEKGQALGDDRRADLLRALHTLKGNSAMLGLGDLRDAVHEVESMFREEEDGDTALRGAVGSLFQVASALREAVDRAGTEEYDRAARRLQDAVAAAGEPGDPDAPEVSPEPEKPPDEDAPSRSGAVDTGSDVLRVPFRSLDDLLDHAGELIGLAASFEETLAEHADALSRAGVLAELESHLDILERISSQLRGRVMDLRLVRISRVFQRFPSLVRGIAQDQGKEVHLEVEGENTEIDKSTADALAEPLLHLIQNAVSHGIEPPEEREAAGKDRTGIVRLVASSAGDRVVLRVEDDGRGLDHHALATRAARLGLIDEAEIDRLRPAEAEALIFRPGFSTRDQADSVSGRGVGLDVVQRTVSELRGQLTAEQRPEGGTRFLLSLPLTLAIIGAVLFEADGEAFAVPTADVEETVRNVTVERASGATVVRHRDDVIPLVRLGRALAWSENGRQEEDVVPFAIVLRIGRRRVAVQVDRLLDQKNVVVKGLPRLLGSLPVVSGATLLPGGRPALLLDAAALASMNLDAHRRKARAG